ncbi:MAG: hypothetical protein ACJ71G_12415 [Nitrososphaeraceae archaeon]
MQQSKTNIRKYIDYLLPKEYEKCLVGLNAITREAWNAAQDTEDNREKLQALSLANCYSMKLELLTNATAVDDAIRFISQNSKGDESIQDNNRKVNETDGERMAVTTNQVF